MIADSASSHLPETALARLLIADRMIAASADADPAITSWREHLAGCPRCRIDLDDARASGRRFDTLVMPRTLPALRQRMGTPWSRIAVWLRKLAAPVAVLATAAAAVLLVVVIDHRHAERTGTAIEPGIVDESRSYAGKPTLQAKGGPILRVVARRGDRVFPVVKDTRLAAGDAIRFQVEPAGARQVLVVSVDGAGRVSVYFPFNGTASAPLTADGRAATTAITLDGSVVLDAAPGPERIWAVLSDRPITVDSVRARLAEIGTGGAAAIRAGGAIAPGQREASVVIEKAAR